jgi:hypothetical protein
MAECANMKEKGLRTTVEITSEISCSQFLVVCTSPLLLLTAPKILHDDDSVPFSYVHQTRTERSSGCR